MILNKLARKRKTIQERLFGLVFTISLFTNCSPKKDVTTNFCYPDAKIVGKLDNVQATIYASSSPNLFYLKQDGAMDTTFEPCNLSKEFQKDSLRVTVSGDIQDTQPGLDSCCILLLVVTKISK